MIWSVCCLHFEIVIHHVTTSVLRSPAYFNIFLESSVLFCAYEACHDTHV